MHSLKRNLKGIIVTSQKTPIHSKPEAEPQSNDLKPFPVRFKAYEPSKVKQVLNCFTNSKKSKTKSKKPHHLKSLSLADSFAGLEAEIDSYLEQRPKTRKFPDNFSKKVKELEGILDKKEEIIENLRQKTCELESKLSNHENSADPLRNWVKDRFVNLFSNEVAVKNQENASELRTELEKERAKNKDLQNLYDKSLENNKVLTERLEKLEDLLSSFNQRQTGSIEGKENVFLEKLTKENKDLFNQLIKNSDQLFEVKLEYKEILHQNAQIVSEYKILKEKNKEIPQLRQHILTLLHLIKNLKHNIKGLANMHVEKTVNEKEAESIKIVVNELENIADQSKTALKSFISVLTDSDKRSTSN